MSDYRDLAAEAIRRIEERRVWVCLACVILAGLTLMLGVIVLLQHVGAA